MSDKIIRVFFKAVGQTFCIDRQADPNKDDQANCDTAVQTLIESMKSGTVIPALLIDDQDATKGHPIFMNLGLEPYIEVTNVGTYNAGN